MRLDEALKRTRKQKGASQKESARAAGISVTQYQNYEYGKSEPTASVLIALASYFNVTIDYLTGKSDLPDYSASEDTAPFPLMAIRLRELREAKGMDIFDVSEAIEENPRNYAGYEAGEVLPRLRVICALADYFDVSLDFLTGRNDNPNSHKL